MSERENTFGDFLAAAVPKDRMDRQNTTRYRKLTGKELPYAVLHILRRCPELTQLFGDDYEALYAALTLCEKGCEPRELYDYVRALKDQAATSSLVKNVDRRDVEIIHRNVVKLLKLHRPLLKRDAMLRETPWNQDPVIPRFEAALREYDSFLKNLLAASCNTEKSPMLDLHLGLLLGYVHFATGGCYEEQIAAILNFDRTLQEACKARVSEGWTSDALRKRRKRKPTVRFLSRPSNANDRKRERPPRRKAVNRR